MLTTAITCAGLAALIFSALTRPGAVVALILCLGVFDQLLSANSSFFGGRSELVNYLVGGGAVLGVTAAALGGHARFWSISRPTFVATVLYAGYFAASTQLSGYASAQRMLSAVAPYWVLLVLVGPLGLSAIRDGRIAVGLTHYICGAAAVFIRLDPSTWADDQRRLALMVAGNPELQSNPLALGDIGAMAFIFSLLHPSFGKFQTRSWVNYGLCYAGLWVTASAARGETLAALMSGFVVFAGAKVGSQTAGRRRIGLLLLVAVIVVVGGNVIQSTAGARYAGDSLTVGASQRWLMVTTLADRFLDDPSSWLLGLGAGYSRLLFGSYPHNQPLQALAETGLVGLLIWAVIPLGGSLALLRSWPKASRHPTTLYVHLCLWALLLYHIILCFKRGGVLNPPLFLAAILADRFALTLRELKEPETAREPLEPLPASAEH